MYCSSNCIEHLVVLAGAGFSFYWLVLPFREINEVRLKKHNCIVFTDFQCTKLPFKMVSLW